MYVYILPCINKNIYKHIQIEYSDDKPDIYISQSLSNYLNEAKSQINGKESKWDVFKKYTNTYEYIHSVIPNKNSGVSKYNPISRSYFKMVELIDEFNFHLDTPFAVKTFHLAEGPGGFIEAVINHRKNKKTLKRLDEEDSYVGMTLLKNQKIQTESGLYCKNEKNNDYVNNKIDIETPPNWKKIQCFLKENINIVIEKGADSTGNILSLSNLIKINEIYGNSIDFVTADGGFDFSSDFSNQELNMTRLIYGQIVYALCIQKKGGSFILKIFDCFMKSTVEMLLLLCSVYDSVYITKPHTSRMANSEKYIVCKGFNHSIIQLYPYLFFSFKEMLETANESKYISGFFSKSIPQYFLQKLEKINILLGEKQLENIEQTLVLMNKYEFIYDNLIIQNQTNWRKTIPVSSHTDEDIDNENNNYYLFSSKWKKYKSNNCEYNSIRKYNNNEEIDSLVSLNISKCINWCIKHNLPITNC